MAGSSLLVWMWQADPAALDVARLSTAVAATLALLAALGHVDATPCRLGWDGADWSVDTGGRGEAQPVRGRLKVMLDLSVAMLLRFQPEDAAAPRRAARWIPVSRRGLPPAQWQALRRTVYSAPPHAGGSPGGDGPRTE